MESTDKLRWRIKNGTLSHNTESELYELADEIEQEIAERYIELPVDSEGVAIHVGDYLESEEYDGSQFQCMGINVEVCKSGKRWTVCMSCDSYSGTSEYTPASRCRHVKPRTIEDMLYECFHDCMYKYPNGIESVIAKYADELRNMGVGE